MKTIIADETHVKLLGRTYPDGDKLWFSLSASGAEFTFTGKALQITIEGSLASTVENNRLNYARFAIYKDDTRVIDCNLDESKKTFTLVDSDEETTHIIRILKLSECAMSTMALCPLVTDDDAGVKPTPAKQRKIEIIGDSITCGYGVDDEDWSHPFVTATEDVTKSYSYKTVRGLDADYSIFSISGYGIISGYTDDPSVQITQQQLPEYYPYYGFSYDTFADGKAPSSLPWDFNRFIPDAVVINLGTNDDSYCQDDPAKQQDYKEHYIAFLKYIRSKYPHASIFCALGLMGDRLYPTVRRVVKEYCAESGDENVYSLHIPPQIDSDGLVSDYHPTERSHNKAAAVLIPFIKVMMGWE